MKRALVAGLAVTALLAGAACGASEDGAEDPETTTTVTGSEPAEGAFGDLEDVCGDGDFTIDPDEAGRGTDKLYIGVANDRGADLRPGLNKGLYDASVAFASWCNDQGGIGGLPIEIIDMDAKLFNVEAVMTTACSDAFAMVGGGLAQDALMFSGKAESDFHMCEMIDIPGFAVSPEKAGSNGQVQPIPNVPGWTARTWFQDFSDLYPDNGDWAMLGADLPSLEVVRQMYEAAVETVPAMTNLGASTYPVIGLTDWTPYAVRIVDSGATSFGFAGEVDNLIDALGALRNQDWDGIPLLETNMYDPRLAAEPNADGSVVRMTFHSLEEADEWPAITQYLDINEQYVDGADVGGIGVMSTTAWLLFAVAANACGELNDGVLDRTCILEQAAAVDDWTGGGLHAPQDPAPTDEATGSNCGMLVVIRDGEFVRLFPELGGEGDDADGFHCPSDGVVEVPESRGGGNVDPDRPI